MHERVPGAGSCTERQVTRFLTFDSRRYPNSAGDGIAVRLTLRETCVVTTRPEGERGTLMTHRFVVAVTGLTALRLRAPDARTGGCTVVVQIEPAAGGRTQTVRAPVAVG